MHVQLFSQDSLAGIRDLDQCLHCGSVVVDCLSSYAITSLYVLVGSINLRINYPDMQDAEIT